jgi:hypothetical protein
VKRAKDTKDSSHDSHRSHEFEVGHLGWWGKKEGTGSPAVRDGLSPQPPVSKVVARHKDFTGGPWRDNENQQNLESRVGKAHAHHLRSMPQKIQRADRTSKSFWAARSPFLAAWSKPLS